MLHNYIEIKVHCKIKKTVMYLASMELFFFIVKAFSTVF